MEQTYCGKACPSCNSFTSGSCPGCAEGPGKSLTMGCPISSCARKKHLAHCSDCTARIHCDHYDSRHKLPRILEQRAASLSPLLWTLLILVITRIVSTLCSSLLHLDSLSSTISICENLAMGIVLWCMGTQIEAYRTASLLTLLSLGTSIPALFLSMESSFLTYLALADHISILSAAYYIYQGHVTVLSSINRTLVRKWTELWSWAKWSSIILSASTVILFVYKGVVLAEIMSIVEVVLSFVILGIRVAEIKYLYLSGKATQACSPLE